MEENMTRKSNLKWLNEQIREEHGNKLKEKDLLISSGCDSFGVTMVLLAINGEYGIYTAEDTKKGLYRGRERDKLKIKHILDDIENDSK